MSIFQSVLISSEWQPRPYRLNWIAHHDAFVVFAIESLFALLQLLMPGMRLLLLRRTSSFSYLRYRVDYAVRADASSVQTNRIRYPAQHPSGGRAV